MTTAEKKKSYAPVYATEGDHLFRINQGKHRKLLRLLVKGERPALAEHGKLLGEIQSYRDIDPTKAREMLVALGGKVKEYDGSLKWTRNGEGYEALGPKGEKISVYKVPDRTVELPWVVRINDEDVEAASTRAWANSKAAKAVGAPIPEKKPREPKKDKPPKAPRKAKAKK